MGEVRAHVKLTNIIDEELMHQGHVSPQQVRTHEANALVDTGAVCTVLPMDVVRRLGLRIRGHRVAVSTDGQREALDVTGPFSISMQGRDTVEEAFVRGDEILIGQTALAKLDLQVDGANRRVVPNPAHPDQAVTRV